MHDYCYMSFIKEDGFRTQVLGMPQQEHHPLMFVLFSLTSYHISTDTSKHWRYISESFKHSIPRTFLNVDNNCPICRLKEISYSLSSTMENVSNIQ